MWIGLSIGLAACGGTEPTPPPPPPPSPASVEVVPASAQFSALGATVALSGVVRDASGGILQQPVQWTSSDPQIAQVLSDGRVVARENGEATITATAGAVQGMATITVAQVATGLSFATQPRDGLVNGEIGPVAVEIRDALGSAVTTATDPITLSLVGPPDVVLDGGTPMNALRGRAVWPSLTLDRPASDLRLMATSGAMTGRSFLFSVVSAFDLVRLPGQEDKEVGILLDGWRRGILANDLGFLATGGEQAVGAVSPGPSNEVAAFARGHLPALILDAQWTPGVDTLDLLLPAAVRIPLSVWIVKGPLPSTRTRALEALATTEAIWDQERTGLLIGDVEIIDATTNPSAAQFFSLVLCGQRAGMEADIGKRAGRINIYYVERVDGGTGRGRACPVGGDFIIMGENTGSELLSHEIGHSFGLGHTDALPQFDQTNVMHSASNTRAFVTEAQTFRMHFETISAMTRTYGIWPETILRNCGTSENTQCPRMEFRLWADGTFPANGLESGPLAALATPDPVVRALEQSCTVDEESTDLTARTLTTRDIPRLVAAYRNGPGTAGAPALAAAVTRLDAWRELADRGGLAWMNNADRAQLLQQEPQTLRQAEQARLSTVWQDHALLTLARMGTEEARAALQVLRSGPR